MNTLKVLVGSDFVAMRKGEFVQATGPGEFIYSTQSGNDMSNGQKLTNGQLKELAKANKLKVDSKANHETLVTELAAHFESLEIPTMSEKPKTELALEIIEAGRKAGKDDETVLIEMVTAGIKFREAGKMFKQIMTEKGWMISSKERAKAIYKILADAEFKPKTLEEVNAMILRIAGQEVEDGEDVKGEVPDTNAKQAMGVLRKYAKDEEFELPKKAAKAGGSFRGKLLDWISANPGTTHDELVAQITELGRGEKSAVIVKRFQPIVETVRAAVETATGVKFEQPFVLPEVEETEEAGETEEAA